MIQINKSIILITIFSLFAINNVNAQRGKKKADTETNEWRYEVEKTGTGKQGTYQLKVWTYSKDVATATEQAKKNAVHAVMFKGIPGSQKPLVKNPNAEQEKSEFFKAFFKDGGKFQKYVFLSNNGGIGPGDRIKISKKEYKIGVVVSVSIASLRKDLEAAGIIKSLSSGF